MTYVTGATHTGGWKDSLQHGLGTMESADGSTYTGEWKKGERVP